jgi:hypoxanthine phosphoribosyltransferase
VSLKPHHLDHVLFTPEKIQERIDGLVDEIGAREKSDNFVMVGILRGSFMFLADLVRDLNTHDLHPRIDFITLESYYGGTESTGTVEIRKDIEVDVTGSDVLLVDDILDTGRTLSFAVQHLESKGARSINTCALLDKPSKRIVDITADHVGFEVDDVFVVGYGLDYDSYYRELPYIAEVTFTE